MKNNKGFTLVELIIVIAIMAVLLGVIAPQYVKYVDKARVAADEQIIEAFSNALMVLSTEEGVIERLDSKDNNGKGNEISIRFDKDGVVNYSDSDLSKVPAVWDVFSVIIDTNKKYQLKSDTYKGVVKEIKLTNNIGNGNYNSNNKIRILYYEDTKSEKKD